MVNIFKNKYMIWLLALIVFALSPQNSNFWYELKGFYLYGFSFTYFEKYSYGYYSVSFWIIRVLSIIINVKIAKTRSENSIIIFWALFALVLPCLSLIINGFMIISDSKKRKKLILLIFVMPIIVILGIYIAGVTTRNEKYSIDVASMNAFMKEFTIENLDILLITRLDSVAVSLDTCNLEILEVLASDSLIKLEKSNDIRFDSKLCLQIKYDSYSRIQYLIESSLTQPSGHAMSVFDSNGVLVLRDIYFLYRSLELVENVKEYYEKGILVKRLYLRKSTSNYRVDINDYILDDRRYDFRVYKTVDDFIENYNLD